MERLLLLNPWADPTDTGFQTIQSLLALGSGFVWVGLGASRQKLYYYLKTYGLFTLLSAN